MENLINFDDTNFDGDDEKKEIKNSQFSHPLLVSARLSLDLNNPFDKLEYRATHCDDPFDCLELTKERRSDEDPAKQDR